MTEPYSPLRYPGGKAKLAGFIIEVLKRNGLREPHYVEPYAGGAGAALRLLFEEYVESVTVNDADPCIRCFWQAVTTHNKEFLDLLENVDVTIEEWNRQRVVYEKADLLNPLDLGFATFFLNRTARSGIIHNGGPIGGFDQTGNYKIDARFNRRQLARRIERIGIYADRIEVAGVDGLALLRDIDRNMPASLQTFVYLDPPYYVKGTDLYLNRFTHSQHAELAAYLCRPRKFPWIMTYDDVPEIRTLYSQLTQVPFNLSYSAFERRAGRELLIYPSTIRIPLDAHSFLPSAA